MPRRKIADIAALKAVADDLPDLTAQQQQFVECLLKGMTATAAFRASYDCSSMLNATIICAASKLRHTATISRWLSVARQAYLGTTTVTRDAHLAELERLREIAIDTGNVGAAVQAETFRGKVGGHYIEQYADLTPHNPAHTLDIIRKISPELALKLAEQAGVKLIEHQAPEPVSAQDSRVASEIVSR